MWHRAMTASRWWCVVVIMLVFFRSLGGIEYADKQSHLVEDDDQRRDDDEDDKDGRDLQPAQDASGIGHMPRHFADDVAANDRLVGDTIGVAFGHKGRYVATTERALADDAVSDGLTRAVRILVSHHLADAIIAWRQRVIHHERTLRYRGSHAAGHDAIDAPAGSRP